MSEAPELQTAPAPQPQLRVARHNTPTILSPDGQESIPLEMWCALEGITAANARGYYIPRHQIPGAFKVGAEWWVPKNSALQRRGQGGKPRKNP